MYGKKILGLVCASLLIVSIGMGSVLQAIDVVPNFGSDVRVDSNSSEQELPSIAVFNPRCAGCQPIIHVVWEDYRNSNWDIYYKRSEDGGKTFGNLLRVNDDTGGTQYSQRHPDIAVDYDGNAHVVWSDERNPMWADKTQIFYAKLAFGASSFSTNIQVSADGTIPPTHIGDHMFKAEPTIATDFQSTCRVHVSWYLYEAWISTIIHGVFYDRNTNCGSGSFGTDLRLNTDGHKPSIAVDSSDDPHIAYVDGNGKIKHVKSSNGGSTFGSATSVTDAQATVSSEPTMAIYPDPSDDIHVAWKDHRNVLSNYNYDIYYSKSTNGGTSFSTNINVISQDLYNRGQGMPSIGVDELGNPHVVWTDYRNDQDGWWVSGGGVDSKNDADIYYAKSTNGGTSFSTNSRVNDWFPISGYDKEQSYPVMAVTGGIATSEIIHVVWMDERNTHFDIYYNRDTPDPDTYYREPSWRWQDELEISTDSGTEDQYPGADGVAVDGTKVHVVWTDFEDGSTDGDILYRYFNGASWETEQEISSDSGSEMQNEPCIAVSGSNVHVVWADAGGGDNDISYRHYDGQYWNDEVEVSSDSGTESQHHPALAVSGSNVHVVWADGGDGGGDVDIYYRDYDGSSWQDEQEISTDTDSEIQQAPSIAVNSDKVHVVWWWEYGGDSDIYYRYYDGSSWQNEVDISADSDTERQWFPSIAVSGSKAHVVWQESPDSGLDWDIYYRLYDSSWQTKMELSTDKPVGDDDQWHPKVAADGSDVHTSWSDGEDGDYDIYYRKYDGSSWGTELEITTDSGTESQTVSSIAANSAGVHVVWRDEGDGDYDVYYNRYGQGYQQEISSDASDEWQFHPSIAVNGDKVHIVWADWISTSNSDIKYRYYDGSSWQTEQTISTDSGNEWQVQPAIAVDGTKVHVVWADKSDGDYDIFYRYYTGSVWQTELEVSTDSGSEWQCQPTIAVDGTGKVHVAWIDRGGGDWDIWYRQYTGVIWQSEVQISTDSGSEWQMEPEIAVDGNKVHVVWMDEGGGDWDIYYRYYTGVIWQSEVQISTDSGTEDQGRPSVAVNSGKVHAVWDDFGGSDWDIFYRYYNGVSWQTQVQISTDSGTEDQWDPSIAIDNTKVHVTWVDTGGGDADIFYRLYDGSTWQNEQEISIDSGTEAQYEPDIAVNGDNVHVVWENWQS
ncbi:MAG: hypothetical protein ACW99U_16675 [Candidatus Thorarchaeota archaeon]|jgi:hypothetical protein